MENRVFFGPGLTKPLQELLSNCALNRRFEPQRFMFQSFADVRIGVIRAPNSTWQSKKDQPCHHHVSTVSQPCHCQNVQFGHRSLCLQPCTPATFFVSGGALKKSQSSRPGSPLLSVEIHLEQWKSGCTQSIKLNMSRTYQELIKNHNFYTMTPYYILLILLILSQTVLLSVTLLLRSLSSCSISTDAVWAHGDVKTF